MLNIENMPSKRKPRQRVMWYCYVQWRIQNFEKGRPGSHYGPWLGVRRQSRPGKLGMRWIYRSWTVLLIWQSTLTPILQLLIIILSLSLPVFHAFSALIFAFSALTVLFVGCQEEHPSCKKNEWWGAGVVICLERGTNDWRMVQLMALPPCRLLLH